jgi:hypothetical protein
MIKTAGWAGSAEIMDVLPTFFIPGAAKSGTSYVAHVLSQHPDIYIPELKELDFFSPWLDKIGARHWPRDYQFYRKHLAPGRGAKQLGEASTVYLYDPETPQLIAEHIPNAQHVIILRNPIERTYSHYWNQIKCGVLLEDFRTGILHWREGDPLFKLLVEYSFYDVQLKRYFECFGRDRVAVFLYDDLKQDPKRFFDGICEFLNVPPLPDCLDLGVRVNVTGVPRYPAIARLLCSDVLLRPFRRLPAPVLAPAQRGLRWIRKLNYGQETYPRMDGQTRRFLVDVFGDHVAELSGLLSRDVSHWLR